jgi:hypothetical protein
VHIGRGAFEELAAAADEHDVAREDVPRVGWCMVAKVGDVALGVARREQASHRYTSQLQHLPVAHEQGAPVDLVDGAAHDRQAGDCPGQLDVAAAVVPVLVRRQHDGDGHPSRLRRR